MITALLRLARLKLHRRAAHRRRMRALLSIRVTPEPTRHATTQKRDGGLTRHWRESR